MSSSVEGVEGGVSSAGSSGAGVASVAGPLRVALLGNPNTGKTTLFNRLTGLRHKTSNFPGTTVEARTGRLHVRAGPWAAAPECCGEGREDSARRAEARHTEARSGAAIEVIDLPGIYSLELDQLEAEVCRAVLAGTAAPRGERAGEPSALCVVADATNLPRSLVLVGEALRRRLPTVVAVNMMDVAQRRGLRLDLNALAGELGCPVLGVCARSGEGVAALEGALAGARIANHTPPGSERGLREWAEGIYARVGSAPGDGVAQAEGFTDRLDRAFTHPVLGLGIFFAVMAGLFYLLFTLAAYPMDLIDTVFASASAAVRGAMPEGLLRDLATDGVIMGIGSTLIFLPQICLLFFVIALLEDTGYLARAAFVADRLLRPFGLPGHAFMPLLSSHACALPGIMATRTIPDRRERLATILVAPFMSCSARLPVYALLTTVLFRDRPALAALAFVGCYALGIGAGIVSALVARRTILRGAARPMALELPSYKRPSVRTALLTTYDRAWVFLKNAGTLILAISVVLWWLSAFPKVAPPAAASDLRAEATAVRAGEVGEWDLVKPEARVAAEEERREARAAALEAEADHVEAKAQQSGSFAGRIGRTIEPALAPMGADWQLSIGVVTSFAAREVFVSTMAVVVAGERDAEAEGVLERLAGATRDDGTPLLSVAACWALLVYYVLAMQCLPTLAVTAREAGGLRWAGLQLAWMTGLAYVAAVITYQVLK